MGAKWSKKTLDEEGKDIECLPLGVTSRSGRR